MGLVLHACQANDKPSIETMLAETLKYHPTECVDTSLGEQQSPPSKHDGGTGSVSWREIFQKQALGPPSLGLDFLHALEDTAKIKYGLRARREGPRKDGRSDVATLILGQNLGKLGLGAVVWNCGMALASFLGGHRHLVKGKRILDLGTGTGVSGLAAAQCGAGEVVLTDYPALGPLVRSNVGRNGGFVASSVSFVPFTWENATDEARTLKFGRDDFDIILASDCLYDPAMFPALRQALVAMCGPQSVFIMAYKRRLDSREQGFFAQLEADFDLEVIHPQHYQPVVASSEVSGTSVLASCSPSGVYLLLGARCECRYGKSRSVSPLDEWHPIGSVTVKSNEDDRS